MLDCVFNFALDNATVVRMNTVKIISQLGLKVFLPKSENLEHLVRPKDFVGRIIAIPFSYAGHALSFGEPGLAFLHLLRRGSVGLDRFFKTRRLPLELRHLFD